MSQEPRILDPSFRCEALLRPPSISQIFNRPTYSLSAYSKTCWFATSVRESDEPTASSPVVRTEDKLWLCRVKKITTWIKCYSFANSTLMILEMSSLSFLGEELKTVRITQDKSVGNKKIMGLKNNCEYLRHLPNAAGSVVNRPVWVRSTSGK